VDVEVITTTADGPERLPASPPSGDSYEGVPVRYVAQAFPKRFFGARLGQPLREALAGADLCHVHGIWNVPEWMATRLARDMHVPYVLSPRGMLHPAARRIGRVRKAVAWHLVERQGVAAAARLHATSEEEVEVLSGLVAPRRIALIPNGVDAGMAAGTAPSAATRARLGVPADAFMVVFIGRLHRIKRLDLLVDAFSRLRAAHASARLVVAGPDEQGCMAALAPMLAPLDGSVRWTGPVDDREKWALLGAASALVLCSDSENFGLSVAEAMAAGVPVVVTRTCPWPDVEREACGYWVAQDARAIAEALEAIADQPDAARAMGDRGARVARERYSWTAVGRAMADCYADVLAELKLGATN
jgi:glycosyltransferase involved in cell wall biosynthesis